MKLFVQAQSRSQCTLFRESLDDFIADDNPVRVIDVFTDSVPGRGFAGLSCVIAESAERAPGNRSF